MKISRVRYFLWHLLISAFLVGCAVSFVVFVWYPPPLAQLEGIFKILLVMAGVDIGAGPLCTLVAASPKKTRGHLARDLAVIATVQIAALGYAVYAAYSARPAFLVYSIGQIEIEHANELSADALSEASNKQFADVPKFGPEMVEARFPMDAKETMRIVNSALSGGPDIKDMPKYFLTWPQNDTDAREKGRKVSSIAQESPLRTKIEAVLRRRHVPANDAVVLPITGKTERGTVVLRKTDLYVVGIVPYLTP